MQLLALLSPLKVRIVAYSLACVLLSACGSNPAQAPEAKAAETLYQEGQSAMQKEQWITAIKRFEELEARFPYGPSTQQGQIDIATAYYKNQEYDNAIASAIRYIRLHPNSARNDYAWYLQGLANFERGRGLMERWFPRKLYRTDSANMQRAFESFRTVAERYPQSQYAKDAQQRMRFLHNELALHELEIARYYFRRGATTATVNRTQYLLQNYPRSPYQQDALTLLAQAYEAQGLREQAEQTRDILQLNR